jgi:hypothetical protein
VELEGDHFKVRHHENARALEILEAIEKKLLPATEAPRARHEIVVSGLSSAQRSQFFVEMARGIAGYELKDERGLQVDRPLDGDSDEEDEEDEPVEQAVAGNGAKSVSDRGKKEAKEQLKGLVKRALLHGTSLLMSQEYQAYSKSGYSLSKLIWTVKPKVGQGAMVEFGAEFRDGQAGTGFRYKVFGKFECYDDGTFAKSRRGVTGVERNTLLALLEDSAYSALEQVKTEATPASPALATS